MLSDLESGHSICATVYVEASSMRRADGPTELCPVGETEVANGVAALSTSGIYGDRPHAPALLDMRTCVGDRPGDFGSAHLRRRRALATNGSPMSKRPSTRSAPAAACS